MEQLQEKLTTKWFDSTIVIPDTDKDVWFIVGDKICVGVYSAEQKMFCMADNQGVELSQVRQWTYLDGEVHKGEYPKENQIVAALVRDFPCFVTGIFSKHFIDTCKNEEVPGLLLDDLYNPMELPFNGPVEWIDVFEWYSLPNEPLLLLPPCEGCPEGISDTMEELIPQVVTAEEITVEQPVENNQPSNNNQEVKSAIVNSRQKESLDMNNEDKKLKESDRDLEKEYNETPYLNDDYSIPAREEQKDFWKDFVNRAKKAGFILMEGDSNDFLQYKDDNFDGESLTTAAEIICQEADLLGLNIDYYYNAPAIDLPGHITESKKMTEHLSIKDKLYDDICAALTEYENQDDPESYAKNYTVVDWCNEFYGLLVDVTNYLSEMEESKKSSGKKLQEKDSNAFMLIKDSYYNLYQDLCNKIGQDYTDHVIFNALPVEPKTLESVIYEVAQREGLFFNYEDFEQKYEINNEDRDFDESKKSTENRLQETKVYYDLTDGTYKPWQGAVDTWDKICDAGKLDALDLFLEDTYPDGLSETELNDILWFESDFILRALGLEEDEDEEYFDSDLTEEDVEKAYTESLPKELSDKVIEFLESIKK